MRWVIVAATVIMFGCGSQEAADWVMEKVEHCDVWVEPGVDTITPALNRAKWGDTVCLRRGEFRGEPVLPDEKLLILTGSPHGEHGWSRVLRDCFPASPPEQLAGPGYVPRPETSAWDRDYASPGFSSISQRHFYVYANTFQFEPPPEFLAGPTSKIMNMVFACEGDD